MTVDVALTRGYVALIDDSDARISRAYQWRASVARSGLVYAVTEIQTNTRRVTLGMHRLVMGWPQDFEIDHIDGDGLNNRRSNLRLCTRAQNARNRTKAATGRFPYKGIEQNCNRFNATINTGGKRYRSRSFFTVEEAARAYDVMALELFGEFARLNFEDSRQTGAPTPAVPVTTTSSFEHHQPSLHAHNGEGR